MGRRRRIRDSTAVVVLLAPSGWQRPQQRISVDESVAADRPLAS